ncbi:unnamed protein product [Prorocentrum cordatum]|uniref:3-beta hydroxysteroid dehydrogenase/isomerase domain-containing protein n=1 Tax=Prorocentrum cordatum TaxID=2364126 RepID=A0ABN9TL35_9DINO|nr:unnamed protein product [Polarella glacialis]
MEAPRHQVRHWRLARPGRCGGGHQGCRLRVAQRGSRGTIPPSGAIPRRERSWNCQRDFCVPEARGDEVGVLVVPVNYGFGPTSATDPDGATEEEMPSLPQATYVQEYAKTKAEAELLVREACSEGLLTIAVAPHQVYGPRDNLFLPNILEVSGLGKLRVFGPGRNRICFTHVELKQLVGAPPRSGITDEMEQVRLAANPEGLALLQKRLQIS